MKRSEMVDELVTHLESLRGMRMDVPDFSEALVTLVLDRVEELGMLPPKIKVSRPTKWGSGHKFVNEWEPEDVEMV